MHRLYRSQQAAEPSVALRMSDKWAEEVVVHVEGLTADSVTPQATLNEVDWYTVEGTKTVDGTDVVSITADGLYRFNLAGFRKFRLNKTGTTDTIDAWGNVIRS